MPFIRRPRHEREYASLPASEVEAEAEADPDTPVVKKQLEYPDVKKTRGCWSVLRYLLTAVIAFFLGAASTRWDLENRFLHSGYPAPPGHTINHFSLNTSFTGLPSPQTEHAWSSLIPRGKGFIKHPYLAPVHKAVSAYHSLHCLHGLRLSYYSRIDAALPPTQRNSYLTELAPNNTAVHLDHCFEYLRQAVICAADSNLEKVREDGEAEGWGDRKVCRDWEGLMRWSEAWRDGDDEGIL